MPDPSSEGHPIVSGLVALVGVGLSIGLIVGLVVLAGTKVAGLGDGSSSASSAAERSMYLPPPQPTPKQTGPEITLAPGESPTGKKAPKEPTKSKSPHKKISLSASTTSASPMEQFDLTGVYPGGEGAILQVQRFASGSWQDFPATGSVGNETFSTPVQTGQPGVNRFRVVDTDTDLKSNQVRVRIG